MGGMEPSKKWVLCTSFLDTTFMRNTIAFDIYRKLGGWAAKTRFINLDIHGKDYGLYAITQKPGREYLDIPPVVPGAPERSGFIVVADWPKDGQLHINTSITHSSFNLHSP